MSLFRRKLPIDLRSIDARRICIIKPSAFGDVVQTLPLLPVLRERFPNATISWAINRGLADLIDGHPQLDQIIPIDRGASLNGWRQLLSQLRREKFDIVFDLQGLLRTAVMTAATRAPLRVGLETAREGSHLPCHMLLPDTGKQVPAHLRYWKVADALGMGRFRRETIVPITPEEHSWAKDQLKPLSGRVVAVHPGARWVTKRWPAERFAAVAAKARRFFGLTTVLVGSRDELPFATQVEHLLNRFTPSAPVINLAGQTSLRQLAAVLQHSLMLLSNDSGPMHLAAGLGTPVVGIFTCTSPERSGPPGPTHELVSTQLACAASYKKRCPYRGEKHMACLEEIEIERVWAAVVRVMEKQGITYRAA
ncbi:MAG: glycosyltransferase family 9 protein [Planctomycetaceae bacterium]|jgi:heptosyltransferase I|nr:glycosyltransferase family 9 protein [Planctomycetaceae bacterium]MBT6156235.1 glycosyltransferase family 9 protein [Planctomycetaceae bacterium]MBT6487897.1 glycosyltransferase family 9 protein [Planctomycetaceae bacterium]MBT6493580.1 glycosyltransferase family 9 protein [Planctomycetaceae bacterium]